MLRIDYARSFRCPQDTTTSRGGPPKFERHPTQDERQEAQEAGRTISAPATTGGHATEAAANLCSTMLSRYQGSRRQGLAAGNLPMDQRHIRLVQILQQGLGGECCAKDTSPTFVDVIRLRVPFVTTYRPIPGSRRFCGQRTKRGRARCGASMKLTRAHSRSSMHARVPSPAGWAGKITSRMGRSSRSPYRWSPR